MAEVASSIVPDGELITSFLARYSGSTHNSYRGSINAFRRWTTERGCASLLEIGHADVEAYRQYLERSGRKPGTVAQALRVVRAFYRFAQATGQVAVSPAESVRLPHVPDDTPAGVLPADEFRRLMAAADERPRDKALVCLLALEGLRVGEVCGAQVRDLVRLQGRPALAIKTGSRQQTIPLMPPTFEAIRAHVGNRQTGALLTTTTGGPMDRWQRRGSSQGSVERPASFRRRAPSG